MTCLLAAPNKHGGAASFEPAGKLQAGLGSRRREGISDTAQLEALLAPAECIQLSPGVFEGTWSSAYTPTLAVADHICNRGIQLRKSVRPDRVLVAFVQSAGMVFEHGRAWSPGQMLVTFGAEVNLSTLAPARITWLEIGIDTIRDFGLSAVTRAGVRSMLLAVSSGSFEELRSRLTGLLENMPARGIESAVLTGLARALASSHPVAGEARRQRRSFMLAESVERFMWENIEEPLTLQWICERMNCRMGRLIYSFKNSFGIGPKRYLKICRLNAARRKLKAARSETRIFDVAADFGFWHMGHFSTDYKRMFGITASETVARGLSRETVRTAAGSIIYKIP